MSQIIENRKDVNVIKISYLFITLIPGHNILFDVTVGIDWWMPTQMDVVSIHYQLHIGWNARNCQSIKQKI